ncbi:hypothetical protein F5Y19DRAFT_472740 [Xylariaceae sp. FL1651]|nr:hypothetical protein F5Y19DRAFT_472740 [Xylariaceae sp. FL1651]
MAPLYKKALILGATSDIGLALAEKLITQGTSVVVTGRRQGRLDAFSIVLSAGIQRPFSFAALDTIDFYKFSDELLTNYTAVVHLVTAFLPHLQRLSKEKEAHLVFISAPLAIVLTMLRTSGYNASKALLHRFIMNLREQLKENGNRVRCSRYSRPLCRRRYMIGTTSQI